MLRAFAIFLVLLAPAASAGVGASADVLPNPSNACSGWESRSDNSTSSSGDGSYSYSSRRGWESRGSCEGRNDHARANVTANDQEAVGVRTGDDSNVESEEFGYSRDDSAGATSANASNGNSSYYANNDFGTRQESGRVAEVRTFTGVARAFEGCSSDFASDNSDGRYSTYGRDEDQSYAFTSDDTWSHGRDSTNCERTARFDNDVADARAGQENPCTRRFSDARFHAEYHQNGTTNETSIYDDKTSYSETECASELFVEAGAARAALGSRSECYRYEQSSNSTTWRSGNASGSTNSSYLAADCTTKTGAFGPNGAQAYLREDARSDESCTSEGCTSGSTASRSIVARHDLAGEQTIALP